MWQHEVNHTTIMWSWPTSPWLILSLSLGPSECTRRSKSISWVSGRTLCKSFLVAKVLPVLTIFFTPISSLSLLISPEGNREDKICIQRRISPDTKIELLTVGYTYLMLTENSSLKYMHLPHQMWCKALLTAFERRNVAVTPLKMRKWVFSPRMWAPLRLTSAVTALSGQPLTQANTLRMLCSRAGSTSTRNWPYLENGVYTLSSLLPRRQPSFCHETQVTKQWLLSLEWLSAFTTKEEKQL